MFHLVVISSLACVELLQLELDSKTIEHRLE